LSHKVESAYDGKFSDELFFEHEAYVTGCIFSAFSFLEATINELFSDTAENPDGFKELDKQIRDLMAYMWKRKILPRSRTLEKYQIALILAQKKTFDKKIVPYKDVDLLRELRNALVHYEPEWITTILEPEPEAITTQKLEKLLSGKFPLNPMMGENESFFPKRCLGHGCAKWAVNVSVKFVDDFFEKMGLTPPYNHIRSRLNTE